MEDANKIEEQMVEDINANCLEDEEVEDEEFVEVIGDEDEVINEIEEEVK